MMNRLSGEKGFNLIEIMVVLAIIGILASMAYPRYKIFTAKSRQSEAKTNLGLLANLEFDYYSDNDEYAALEEGNHCAQGSGGNDLGFYLNCKDARYSYSVTLTEEGGFLAKASSGTGKSNKIMPGCETPDVWTINEDRELKAESDATKLCR